MGILDYRESMCKGHDGPEYRSNLGSARPYHIDFHLKRTEEDVGQTRPHWPRFELEKWYKLTV